MEVHYDNKIDMLYIRLDERKQKVTNKRITDEIVLDIGKNGKIIAIEILDASKRLSIKKIFPAKIEKGPGLMQKPR